MYRQSPSRNQRSKGVKVKYAIQICLLIAVSFWLVYQVKHSHDKKKEFDESEAKASLHIHNSNGRILGRKGINDQGDETTSVPGDKLHESIEEEDIVEEDENKPEEDENKPEEDGNKPEEDESKMEEEEENKPEEDENKSEEDENKPEEYENKREEDEHEEKNIDHAQESSDADEIEAREVDSGDGQTEGEKSLSDDSNHDGNVNNNKSTHEARDENYKADDASSAVTHEARLETGEKTVENVNGHTENSTEHPEINVLGEDNKEVRKDIEVEGGEIAGVGQKSNVMISESNVELLDSSENGSPRNDTLIIENSSHELTNGSAEVEIENHDFPKPKHELDNDSQVNEFDSKSSDSAETKDAELQKSEDFSNSSNNSTESLSSDSSVGSGNKTESSSQMEDEKEVEKSDLSIGTSEKLESTGTGNPEEEILHDDSIDESDVSSDLLEEKHVRDDLDTLPDIQTEGTNSEDDVAEE